MDAHGRRAREIQDRIRQILLRDWDPLGIAAEPEAQSEYEAYIGGVHRLIASGATATRVAEHLASIEADEMGLAPQPGRQQPAAEALVALDARL